jgi:predicted GNAT family acetyltransferase
VAERRNSMNDHLSSTERDLDQALEETFPASDPPANTVTTGIRIASTPAVLTVTDNLQARRFELTVDGQTAFLTYERARGALRLLHTEVPPSLRGRRLGDALVKGALDNARAEGRRVVAVCPFVQAYQRKHPESL